jgi:hypothetical protein
VFCDKRVLVHQPPKRDCVLWEQRHVDTEYVLHAMTVHATSPAFTHIRHASSPILLLSLTPPTVYYHRLIVCVSSHRIASLRSYSSHRSRPITLVSLHQVAPSILSHSTKSRQNYRFLSRRVVPSLRFPLVASNRAATFVSPHLIHVTNYRFRCSRRVATFLTSHRNYTIICVTTSPNSRHLRFATPSHVTAFFFSFHRTKPPPLLNYRRISSARALAPPLSSRLLSSHKNRHTFVSPHQVAPQVLSQVCAAAFIASQQTAPSFVFHLAESPRPVFSHRIAFIALQSAPELPSHSLKSCRYSLSYRPNPCHRAPLLSYHCTRPSPNCRLVFASRRFVLVAPSRVVSLPSPPFSRGRIASSLSFHRVKSLLILFISSPRFAKAVVSVCVSNPFFIFSLTIPMSCH